MLKNYSLFELLQKFASFSKTTISLVVLLSLTIALTIWSVSKSYYDSLILEKFEVAVDENIDMIEKRMSRYEGLLQSGVGFFLGSDYVSREDWHHFTQALNIKKNYPGIQGIGFSKMLLPDEVSKIEDEMQKSGFTSFHIKPTGTREQYSSILYLEPMDKRNLEAIGYDMFSEPTRRRAMELARDTGSAAISGKVTLVQEIDSDIQPGMLMYMPLYKKGAKPENVAQRRQALVGFIYSPFRMNNLMHNIVLETSILNFKIYDNSNMTDTHLLYSVHEQSLHNSKYSTIKELKLNGRIWHIYFSSTKKFDNASSSFYPMLITLFGLIAHFFFLYIIYILIRSKHMLKNKTDELLKFSHALEQSPSAIIITDLNGNIDYVNEAFCIMSGYSKNEVIGKNPGILKSGKTEPNVYKEMWTNLVSGKTWHGEFINKQKNGTYRIESIKASPIFKTDGTISYYMAIKEDITEKKRSLEHINYLANFDSLTGLPNRFKLQERINYTINIAKRNNEHFTVMFLDLDHFKEINDTLGHNIGDVLLINLANRFKSILRKIDTASRLGGDEFIFVLPNTNADGASHIAQKLINIANKPVKFEENELLVTASIGIAIYPKDGENQETLFRNADSAMYRAKQDGRNKYYFF